MKVVMDTSSLISLGVVDLIDFPFLEIYTSKAVENELKEISKYEDEEGRAASKVLKSELHIKEIERRKVEKYLDKDVDEGGATCFALCKEESIDTLLIDDVGASYSLHPLAMREGIKLRMSFAVLSEMLRRALIEKEKAKKKIKKMVKLRNWGGSALEHLADKWFDQIE